MYLDFEDGAETFEFFRKLEQWRDYVHETVRAWFTD